MYTYRINKRKLGLVLELRAQERQLCAQVVDRDALERFEAADELAARELAHRGGVHAPAEHEDHWILRIDPELVAERKDPVVCDRVDTVVVYAHEHVCEEPLIAMATNDSRPTSELVKHGVDRVDDLLSLAFLLLRVRALELLHTTEQYQPSPRSQSQQQIRATHLCVRIALC